MAQTLIGLTVGLLIGAGCRYFDIPSPAPPRLIGAFLLVAMTLGFVVAGQILFAAFFDPILLTLLRVFARGQVPQRTVGSGVTSMVAQRCGRIVNIASVSAERGGGTVGNVLYGTTKAGVVALTKGFARELAPFGITVNAVASALTDTSMTRHLLTPGRRREALARIPLGRFAATAEIANVVVFLASDAAAYITGETLAVDGGFLTR